MSKSLDRITLLHTFIRIAETGSLSAAARDLNLSQPSVSRQLVDLEQRLQTQLARRNTHALTLTDAGKELLNEARQMVNAWNSLEERFLGANNEVRGSLKVIAPVALGQTFLATLACEFQQAHPGVNINWELQDEDIRFSEVGCDCWIKIGPINDDTLIVRPLASVERLLVASPQLVNGKTYSEPSKLSNHPLVALTPFEGQKVPLSSSTNDTYLFSSEVSMRTNNIFSLKEAALMGMGLAVLPRWFIQNELKSGSLVDVLPKWRAPQLTIHVGYLPNRHQPNRLRLFLQSIAEKIVTKPGINAIS